MKNFKNRLMLAALLGVPALMLGKPALAQPDLGGQLDGIGSQTGLSDNSLPEIVGNLVNVFLGILGLILFLLVLYSGFLWMTAGGNTERVDKAKKYLINAVIGLVITVAAYAISGFVVEQIAGAV